MPGILWLHLIFTLLLPFSATIQMFRFLQLCKLFIWICTPFAIYIIFSSTVFWACMHLFSIETQLSMSLVLSFLKYLKNAYACHFRTGLYVSLINKHEYLDYIYYRYPRGHVQSYIQFSESFVIKIINRFMISFYVSFCNVLFIIKYFEYVIKSSIYGFDSSIYTL